MDIGLDDRECSVRDGGEGCSWRGVGGAYPSMGAFRTAHEVSVDQSGMTKRTGKVTRLKRVISPLFVRPDFHLHHAREFVCYKFAFVPVFESRDGQRVR